MNREDFPILSNDLIYLDNGATSLKPFCVIDKMNDYYFNYSANAHRGDYELSLKVDYEYENTRKVVKEFINASKMKEIVFTSGTTDSINKVVFGYFKNVLKNNDEVLITKSEHASNVLPWFELSSELGIKVNYIELNAEHKVTLENVINAVTPNTKVISIAHVTNVIGDIRPIKEIIKYAHSKNIIVLIDGAQSVAHMPIDVQDLDVDFLCFSAHKMLGPTGVGVLYGKENILKECKPIIFGGGMNSSFDFDGTRVYHELPSILEAGTPNIAGVIGLSSAITYLKNIGMNKINNYERELRKYFIEGLKKNSNIVIYNEESESGIVTFNYNGVFSQDLAIYLSKFNICVRSGNHCAKILKDELGIKNTCRVSLYFYNTKEEVDKLLNILSNPNLISEII